jgi:3-phytase
VIKRLLVPAMVIVLASSGAPAATAATVQVNPAFQTRAFVDDGDANPANADADDPAIWIDRRDPRSSVVLGTLKEGGLAAFDLTGAQLALLPAPAAPGEDAAPGRFNNVDVLGDLAIVSDRGRDRIRVYRIDPRGAAAGRAVLRDVTDPHASPVFSASEAEVDDQRTVYGLAAGIDGRGRRLVAVTQRHETRIAIRQLVDRADGTVGTEPVTTVELPGSFSLPDGTEWAPCEEPGERPQSEGMVFDLAHGVLYAAQEDVGIWRIPVPRGKPELVDKVRSFGVPQRYDEASEQCVDNGADPGFGGKWLVADAEGLAIAAGPRDTGRLLASSQGDSRFVVYDRTGGNRPLGDFTVAAKGGLDSVEHSDGAAVTTTALGPNFPQGLLVLHDGERRPAATAPDGTELPTTGFAFVRWESVTQAIPN